MLVSSLGNKASDVLSPICLEVVQSKALSESFLDKFEAEDFGHGEEEDEDDAILNMQLEVRHGYEAVSQGDASFISGTTGKSGTTTSSTKQKLADTQEIIDKMEVRAKEQDDIIATLQKQLEKIIANSSLEPDPDPLTQLNIAPNTPSSPLSTETASSSPVRKVPHGKRQ